MAIRPYNLIKGKIPISHQFHIKVDLFNTPIGPTSPFPGNLRMHEAPGRP